MSETVVPTLLMAAPYRASRESPFTVRIAADVNTAAITLSPYHANRRAADPADPVGSLRQARASVL